MSSSNMSALLVTIEELEVIVYHINREENCPWSEPEENLLRKAQVLLRAWYKANSAEEHLDFLEDATTSPEIRAAAKAKQILASLDQRGNAKLYVRLFETALKRELENK